MVVRDEGLPKPLGGEAFLLPSWPHRGQDPSRAARPPAAARRSPAASPGATLLVAEAACPEGGASAARRAREAVLETVEAFLPFVERHYLVVDSPHDGRPLWDFRTGARSEVDRAALRARGGSLDAEPMAARWRVEPAAFRGLAARSPSARRSAGAFVVGPSALPALGQEGELLAAWSAARLITRTDRRREKMRREMWSKIELG